LLVEQTNAAEMRVQVAKLGLAAVLAYGLFDGVTYTSFFVLAFLGYEKSTGQNPAANLKALLGVSYSFMPDFQVSMAHCECQNSLCCPMCIGWACAIFLHDKHGDSFIVQLVEGALPALSYINLFLGPDWVVQNCTLLV
jgi:hypothetical protein